MAAVLVGLILYCCLLWILVPLGSVAFVLAYLGFYLHELYRVLVTAPPAPRYPPQTSPGLGDQPAYRQYFFGQASTDLVTVATTTQRRCDAFNQQVAAWITRSFFGGPTVSKVVGSGAFIVMAFGVVSGAIMAGLALAVQAALVGVMHVVAWIGIGMLRATDTVLLRIRGIRITCGTCHHRVPYPVYACPGPACSLRHTDVRPGRYGVFRRVCSCGTRLPTLLLLGSYRLQAFCPYCGHALVERSGTAAEIIVPFMGGTAAGKTRLMLALVFALEQLIAVEFASADTRVRLNELRPALSRGLPTRATPRDLPRAYSLYVTSTEGKKRLVHLFDVAGERLNRPEDMHELRYLGLARMYLFVLDPLSVNAFWETLREPQKRQLASLRSPRPPHDLFVQAFQELQALGVTTRRARLLVALSKNDLLPGPQPPAEGTESEAIEGWLVHQLGLGNLVRAMKHDFGTVVFTRTAAVLDGRGAVDPSVIELARRVLEGQRLPLP